MGVAWGDLGWMLSVYGGFTARMALVAVLEDLGRPSEADLGPQGTILKHFGAQLRKFRREHAARLRAAPHFAFAWCAEIVFSLHWW